MAKRSKRQQNKHDNEVSRLAKYYQQQDFQVNADIEGFNQPTTINGRRPDIIAKKKGKTVIVEVETIDSLKKDQNQRQVFKRYTEKHKNTRFWTKIVK